MSFEQIRLYIGIGLIIVVLLSMVNYSKGWNWIKSLKLFNNKKIQDPAPANLEDDEDSQLMLLLSAHDLLSRAPECCKKEIRDLIPKLLEGDHE